MKTAFLNPVASRVIAVTACLIALADLLQSGAAAAPAGNAVHGSARVGDSPAVGAVVWLDAPDAPRASEPTTVVLDQRNLKFHPRVLAARVGSVVEFPNHDRVFHNVFSFQNGKLFDLGMYPTGTVRQVTFDRPGVSRIFCNIHPQMAAYIVMVDSPYFAVADQSGRFTIANVPPATYTYHAWRSAGAELSATVAIDAGTVIEVQWR
jgi:plastocyanin